MDNLLEFHTWKSPKEILTQVDLIVMNRPDFPEANNEFSRHAKFVNVPQMAFPEWHIRRRVKLGRSIRYLVPRSVEEYIVRRRLYKD